jgi:hypothetical protein
MSEPSLRKSGESAKPDLPHLSPPTYHMHFPYPYIVPRVLQEVPYLGWVGNPGVSYPIHGGPHGYLLRTRVYVGVLESRNQLTG